MITVYTFSPPNLSMFIEEDLSAASDPVFLLEHAPGIVSSFTVFSEMQFPSCPVYYAPSSSPLMVSLHLHDLESEGILCLSFLNPLPILSLVLWYCVFFFFFLSSLKAMGIIPVLLLIHYFNKCALSTFSMQQYSYKWTKSVLREFIPLIRNVFNRLLNKQLKHIEYHMKNSAMKNWSWRGNTMKELW